MGSLDDLFRDSRWIVAPRDQESGEHKQRIFTAVRVALFKITLGLRHVIGDVCQADHRHTACLGKCIKRRCFHLHRQHVVLCGGTNRLRCFPKGSIGCPDGSAQHGKARC